MEAQTQRTNEHIKINRTFMYQNNKIAHESNHNQILKCTQCAEINDNLLNLKLCKDSKIKVLLYLFFQEICECVCVYMSI